jgi:hypothetical protein
MDPALPAGGRRGRVACREGERSGASEGVFGALADLGGVRGGEPAGVGEPPPEDDVRDRDGPGIGAEQFVVHSEEPLAADLAVGGDVEDPTEGLCREETIKCPGTRQVLDGLRLKLGANAARAECRRQLVAA